MKLGRFIKVMENWVFFKLLFANLTDSSGGKNHTSHVMILILPIKYIRYFLSVVHYLSNGHSPQIRQNGKLLAQMCRGESHFCQKWRMSNVSECIESGESGWRMSANVSSPGKVVGECRANVMSPGKVVGECRANVSSLTKTGWQMSAQAR